MQSDKSILRITDTSLRDAHQSLWATRMRTADILGIVDILDSVGYYSLECWGGATFDVCLRFLRENPWERLRQIKAHCPRTPLQMLLRGQNVLGYRNYPDDVVDRFVELAAQNGISIFRVFDALNDSRNLERAIRAVKRCGVHAQGTISYTVSPVHTVDAFVALAREQEQLGVDSICVKDMAGILTPAAARELVSALAAAVSVPIQIHSHATSGMVVATYLDAIRAGAGALDCATSTLSGYSSQPAVGTILAVAKADGFECGLDLDAIDRADAYFRDLKARRAPGFGKVEVVDTGVLRHHIPGGMISNLRSQLAQQDALDRLDEVLAELPRTRADLGYPPLVTPTSQIVGVQSVLNVLSGERYSMVTKETRDYVKGLYGRSPAPVDPALARRILAGEKPVTCRPADLLPPGLPAAADALDPHLAKTEEDILSYCLFPEVALDYFKWRALPAEKRPPIPADLEAKAVDATPAASNGAQTAGGASVPAAPAPENAILAPLNGVFYRASAPGAAPFAEEGATVKEGDTLCVVEAMKLFNPVKARSAGKVVRFLARHGDRVAKGQPIVEVAPA